MITFERYNTCKVVNELDVINRFNELYEISKYFQNKMVYLAKFYNSIVQTRANVMFQIMLYVTQFINSENDSNCSALLDFVTTEVQNNVSLENNFGICKDEVEVFSKAFSNYNHLIEYVNANPLLYRYY